MHRVQKGSNPNTILFYILLHTYVHTYIHTYIFTHLLTPCSRVLLEKLTGFTLVKKFPLFYGTRMFITAFISGRHLSLSRASTIQSIPWSPEDPSLYYPPIYVWVSQVVSCPQASPPKPYQIPPVYRAVQTAVIRFTKSTKQGRYYQ